MMPQFPRKRERETQSVGIESVNLVVILWVVVVGCGYGGFLHRELHGCLCRWGETTMVLVEVVVVIELVVLVQTVYWAQRMTGCVHVPFVR